MCRWVCLFVFFCSTLATAETLSLKQKCEESLKKYKSYFKEEVLEKVCEKAVQPQGCESVKGAPIYHMDYPSSQKAAKKILVISLIHGDETYAGTLGRFWLERLAKLDDARNSWRVIPVANPDGVKNKTRMNENGIDLNRNFPTVDWTADAVKFWERTTHKQVRKFPGYSPGSEPEVKCLMKEIEDYTPDFIISIHTPLHVLDFDGPKIRNRINYSYLPWRSLGNFPGSLGRYMWVERQTPVLTTELKSTLPANENPFEELQDLAGTLVQHDFFK